MAGSTIAGPMPTFTAKWPDRLTHPRTIVLVGAGGTGARLGAIIPRLVRPTDVIMVVDHDRVEERNLVRQHFVASDVGHFKADIVARRLIASCPPGTQVHSITARFGPHVFQSRSWPMDHTIVVGAVDNLAARVEIRKHRANYKWWIDAGNDVRYGQVILSASVAPVRFEKPGDLGLLTSRGGTLNLSYDGVTYHAPTLMTPPTEETEACGMRVDSQTVGANQTAATVAGNVLAELLDELPIANMAYEFCTNPTMVSAVPMVKPDPKVTGYWDMRGWPA